MSRASYLSPPDFQRLNWSCRPIADAFGEPVYLVGSVLTKPNFRDIDLRLILDDQTFNHMFRHEVRLEYDGQLAVGPVRFLLNIAISDLIAKTAGLSWPIDFQIQSIGEANAPENLLRNPLGIHLTPGLSEVAT